MKIREANIEYNSNQLIEITSAEHLGDHIIKISFSDGKRTEIDFSHFLKQSSHPSIKKYLNTDLLKQFKIINGNLNWNDFDMIFPLEDLYSGVIH